jgi:uncharacterized protein (TIGR00661 family)
MKNILVAPLNWGLGHATRCIPIINELIKNNYNPIIATDGVALALLKKEFPNLLALELPSYHIEYAKKGKNFKWKLLQNSPNTINAIVSEKKVVKKWVSEYNLSGIISDNRLGVYSKKVPSVFITHQIRVMSGKTTWISSKIHQKLIKKYTECWVPDVEGFPNLSGKLGHVKKFNVNLRYIGVLSRLEKEVVPEIYDLMVIISGPEPQRTLLEEKLISELNEFSKPVLFVKGKVEAEQKIEKIDNIVFYNFMTSDELQKAFNCSNKVLCRSGYTTVMDLAKLEKKAFFIPTPGQFEQEYLAKLYHEVNLVPTASQDDFTISDLKQIDLFRGLPKLKSEVNWTQLFALFKGE